ncbi:MAG TPA: TolC family protein [Candidatus Binataceae bacterium]|nr:TolC family protein [Candidatus Binataceae bacterium]
MKSSHLLALILMVGFAGHALAAWPAQLSLHECIDEALDKSPDLASSRHMIEAARADITKKRGTLMPYLAAQASAYVVNGQPVNEFSVLNLFNAATGVTTHNHANWDPLSIQEFLLTYPLFYEGSLMGLNDPPAVASSRATMTEQQAVALVNEQKVIFNVVSAYVNVASFEDQLALQEQIVAGYQRQFDIVETQRQLGLKLPKDVEIARGQLQSATDAAESLRQSALSYKIQLAELMGRGADRTLEIEPTPPPMPQLAPLDEFLAQVMPNNPSLMVDEAKIEVARQQVRVDKVAQWPIANLNTNFATGQDLEHFNGSSRFPRPVLYESYITITMPLWDFGQRRAAEHESDENLAVSKETLKATAETLRTSITQVYGQISAYERTTAALEASYLELERESDLTRAQRQAGVADELSLVAAKLAEDNAKLAVISEQLEEQLQYASLQNLAGGNWSWVE